MNMRGVLVALLLVVTRIGYAQEVIRLTVDRPEFCLGGTLVFVYYDVTGITFDPTNEFIVEMSDSTGDFSAAIAIGKLTSYLPQSAIEITFPLSTVPASGYRLRLRTTNPARIGLPNDTDITIYAKPQVSLFVTPIGIVCDNTPVTFKASGTGGGPTNPQYTWSVNGSGVAEGDSLVKTSHEDGDLVSCTLFVGGCNVRPSASIEMDVTPRPTAVISANPGPILCAPGSVTLTAVLSGATATSYSWYRYDTPVGSNSSTYQVNLSNVNDFARYKCVVAHDGPACYSSPVSNEITVGMQDSTVLSVDLKPPAKICKGVPATFYCDSPHGARFEWTKNDQPVTADSPYYTDVLVVGDVIKVKVFGLTCADVPEKESEPYTVTQVGEQFEPEVQIHQYPEGDVSPDTKVVLTVETIGSGVAPGFRWFKNGADVTPYTGGDIYGNGSEPGGIFAVTPQNGDQFEAIMTSTDLCALPKDAQSNTIQISVTGDAPHATTKWLERGSGPFNIVPDAFSIGSKAYVVSGRRSYGSGTNPTDEFWEYDVATNRWTKKASFGFLQERDQAAGFAANGKGFIGLGLGWNAVKKKDFWRYDTAANVWTQVTPFPGSGSLKAFSIGVDTKGYVGMLSDAENFSDFWEYDAVADNWTKLPDFPGQRRNDLIGFVVGKKIYVGMGANGDTFFRDFWEYDTESNVWTAKSSFPGEAHLNATAFAISTVGFYGLGYDLDRKAAPSLWQYNPELDSWTVVEGYIPFNYASSLYNAVGFNVQDRAFVYSSRRFRNGVTMEFNPFAIVDFESEGRVGELSKIAFRADIPFAPGNIFTVQLSSDTLFNNYLTVGSLASAGSTGTIDVSIPVAAIGDQYVRIVSSNPAITTSPIQRQFLPVGIEAGMNSVAQTYPNPVVHNLIIKLPAEVANKVGTFTVLNEFGQQVLVGYLPSTENVVDFSGQSSGLYLLKVNIDKNTITRKIVFNPSR